MNHCTRRLLPAAILWMGFCTSQALAQVPQDLLDRAGSAAYRYGLLTAPSEVSFPAESAVKAELGLVSTIQNQISLSQSHRGPSGVNAWVSGNVTALSMDNYPGFPHDPDTALSGTAGTDYTVAPGLIAGFALSGASQNSSLGDYGSFKLGQDRRWRRHETRCRGNRRFRSDRHHPLWRPNRLQRRFLIAQQPLGARMKNTGNAFSIRCNHLAGSCGVFYIAILAVLLAICFKGTRDSAIDARWAALIASDNWAFYQAKSTRLDLLKLAVDVAQTPGMLKAIPKQIEEKLAAYNAEIARVESNPVKGDGRKELAARARAFESARDAALKRGWHLGYAGALLLIAAGSAFAGIVFKNRLLLAGAGLLSILGLSLMVNGLILAASIPNRP